MDKFADVNGERALITSSMVDDDIVAGTSSLMMTTSNNSEATEARPHHLPANGSFRRMKKKGIPSRSPFF